MSKAKLMAAGLRSARALGRGDYREVIRILEPAVESYGEDYFEIWKLAFCYMRIGEYDQAIEWGSRGLALQPRDPQLLELLAGCYSKQGDQDRAYQCVCRALEQPSREPMKLGWLMKAVFKLFSLHPKLRRVDPESTQRGLDKVAQDHNNWRGRAAEYKKWYEAEHGPADG